MALFSKDPPGDRDRTGTKGFVSPASSQEEKTGTRLRRADLEALLQDLDAGAQYQRSLMPPALPSMPGYDVAVFTRPARVLSGDFYDLQAVGENRFGMIIADASGKGIPAGLLAMVCHVLFRSQPERDAPPARVLHLVNAMMSGNIKRGTFVSGIYAVLDTALHQLAVANAGHLPLVVWRARAKIAMTYSAHCPVLGVLPPSAYEQQVRDEIVSLGPGDRFLLITDGVNEAMAPGQKEFGMEHLRRRLLAENEHSSASFLKSVIDQIDLHRGGGDQSDDITILTGRRLA